MYENITGTPNERSAADFVSYRLVQDRQFTCLREQGFKYPLHPSVDKAKNYPLNGASADRRWLAPLGSDYLTRQLRVVATFAQAKARVARMKSPYDASPATAKKYRATLALCEQSLVDVHKIEYPAGYSSLLAPYNRMLATVEKQLDRYAPRYRSCLRGAGLQAGSYPQLAATVVGRAPHNPMAVPAVGEPSHNGQWNDVVAYESRAIGIDARCRREAHDVGYTLLQPALRNFEQAHAATLARLRAEWRSTERKAAWYRSHPLTS